jgi:DNA-binding MarR family transcriptional regulator
MLELPGRPLLPEATSLSVIIDGSPALFADAVEDRHHGEVARRVGVAPSTASRQLRPLERHRFIARDASDADRRVAQLRVTPTGERALARARDVMLNDYEVALRGWSAQDRARLGVLLAHLRDDLLRAQVDARGWSVAKAPRAKGA